MNEGEILHLVIIEETGEKAASHALILRNAGLSFRSDSVHNLGSLKSRLDSALPDMIICGEGPGVPDLQSVRNLLNERGADIPLIPLVNEAPVSTASAARNAGTDTLVPYSQAEDMVAAVSRGQERVLLRRKIGSLEQALMESELVCHVLMETCRDTTAYPDADTVARFSDCEHFGRSGQPQLIDHLPVDIIKIDGSLVDSMVTNKNSQMRIQSIVETAHKVGKLCIAERVDNTCSLAKLWQFGVDYIQGNFVQEPSRDLVYDFESEVG